MEKGRIEAERETDRHGERRGEKQIGVEMETVRERETEKCEKEVEDH